MKIVSLLFRTASVALCVVSVFASSAAEAVDHPLSDGGDIAAAVATAADGDTITLGEGTYNVNGLTVDKAVTIRAAEGEEATLDLQSKANGIVLSADGAIVKGCKLVNCRTYAVKLQADGAKLLDCVCSGYNEISGTSVSNFLLQKGEIRRCTFSGFSGNYAYKNYIIEMTGGTFADSLITDCPNQFDWMVSVNGDSAIMTNVVIRNSLLTGGRGGDNLQDAVLHLSKGLVTHCVITNSGCSNHAPSGTVLIDGGTLRNSLVADCQGPTYPGVQLKSGRMENCTVANNSGAAGTVTAYSLTMSGGTAVNNLFADAANSAKSVVVSGGTFVTNLIPFAVSYGVGNPVGKPSFVAPEKGDYSPGFASLAVNSADRLAWMTEDAIDVRGESRIKGTGPDMGAFEGPYGENDPLSCGASIENNVFRSDCAEGTVRFFGMAVGAGAATATYAWYLDGAETPAGTDKNFSLSGLAAGLHTVKLVVTPEDTSLEPAELTMKDCVLIYPPTVYVDSANENPQAPYDTWNNAAKTIHEAMAFLTTENAYLVPFGNDEDDRVTVEVRDGTYVLAGVTLKIPVRLVAASGAQPVLDTNKSIPGITLMNAANVIDGFRITHANKYGVQLYNGSVMRNCSMIDANNGVAATSDAIVLCSPGVVSNCLFSGATAGYAYFNCMIKLEGASLVSGCTFEKMKNHDFTLYVTGEDSVVSNCVLRDCPMDSCGGNLRYNMIDITAGLVTHCVITNCGSTSTTGDGDKGFGAIACVRGAKATLRNCLLVDNKAKAKAGIFVSAGKVENCTVLGGQISSTADGTMRNLYQTGGSVVNSIFWNSSNTDGAKVSAGCSFTYSSSKTLKDGEGNKSGDPGLEAFVPNATSIARDTGNTDLDWIVDGAVDLRGSNRVVNARVDMGAFEGDELPPELALKLESAFLRLEGDQVVYRLTPSAVIGSEPVVDPEYVWTLDGEAAGTSSGAKDFTLAPRVAPYVIGCSITASQQTKGTTVSQAVHSGEFFIDASVPEEDSKYPYSSWGTAARTLSEVMGIAHPVGDTRTYKVHVAAGNYSTGDASLTTALQILCEDGVFFTSGSAIIVNNDQAAVSNCVFNGRGFTLTRGWMRDIVVRNRSGQSGGTLISIAGGTCENLVVTNCRTTAWNFQNGIDVSGSARLTNLMIDNCAGYDKLLYVRGTATVSNGTITASNGVLGSGQGNTHEYAICAEGGLVSHVSATDCGDVRATSSWSSREGTVRVAGGTVRNCLFAGNRSTDCPGVYLTGGSLESCTVVVNDGDSLHKSYGGSIYGSCLTMSGGSAMNCVFYSKETAEDGKYYCRVTGGKIGNCWLSVKGSDPTPSGTDVLTGDNPGFKTVGGWEYVPAGGSQLLGKGLNQPWMTGAKDFAGRDRIAGRKVDIGAFEGDAPGLMMLVR